MTVQASYNRAAYVLIDRSAISHNLQRVREIASNTKVMAVIKADGYGHSMEVAAQALDEADEFAVTSLDDVSRLRSKGFNKPITMLSATFTVDDLNSMSALSVRPVIYDHEQLNCLIKLNKSAKLDLWIKIDTGMGRLGLSIEEAKRVLAQLSAHSGVNSILSLIHI